MSDTLNFTLKYPLTQEDFNIIADAEFEHSDTIWFVTPKGKKVEFRKVVKGEWIIHNSYGSEYLECPYCRTYFSHEHLVRNSFCPNCGAEMRSRLQGTEIDGMYIDISGDGTVIEQI